MLTLSSIWSGVGLSKTGFLACFASMGGAKLALDRTIWDSGQRVPCAYHVLNPEVMLQFERWEEEVSKFAPNFQYRF